MPGTARAREHACLETRPERPQGAAPRLRQICVVLLINEKAAPPHDDVHGAVQSVDSDQELQGAATPRLRQIFFIYKKDQPPEEAGREPNHNQNQTTTPAPTHPTNPTSHNHNPTTTTNQPQPQPKHKTTSHLNQTNHNRIRDRSTAQILKGRDSSVGEREGCPLAINRRGGWGGWLAVGRPPHRSLHHPRSRPPHSRHPLLPAPAAAT